MGDFSRCPSVGRLSRLSHGDLLELPAKALSEIELRTATVEGPVTVAKGRLGATDWSKAVRLESDPDRRFLAPLVAKAEASAEE